MPTPSREEKIESGVNITHEGSGYIICVEDQFTENKLAVTRDELEAIVLYGQAMLKANPPKFNGQQ